MSYFDQHTGRLRHTPYQLIASLPDIENPVEASALLNYFGVNLPMLLEYVLSAWPLFMSQDENGVYEFIVEEINAGCGFFKAPVNCNSSQEYFHKLELLMDLIFKISAHLKHVLWNAMDVSDEADQTQMTCIEVLGNDSVVIGIQKEFVYG